MPNCAAHPINFDESSHRDANFSSPPRSSHPFHQSNVVETLRRTSIEAIENRGLESDGGVRSRVRALDRRKDSSAKKTIRGGCSRGRARRFVRGSGSMGFVAVLVILWDSVTTASASFGIERWGGIGEVEGTSGRSRLVKSSPPHCLQYLVEARSSSSVRVARESSISIATRTSHRPVLLHRAPHELGTRFSSPPLAPDTPF